MDSLHRRAPVIPARVFIRLLGYHGRVGLEKQNFSISIQAEVDTPIIETDRASQPYQRRHGTRVQNSWHIGQELRFLRTMLGTVTHVGAEIVDLPLHPLVDFAFS
jgi:hypothetical protein